MEQENLSVIDDFEDLNKKLTNLKKLILKMKVEYDFITKTPQVIKATEEMVNQFLDQRPLNCQVLNKCSTILQKMVMKTLRVFSESGYYKTNQLVNRYLTKIDVYAEKEKCQDNSCLTSAKLILNTIRDYLDKSDQSLISDFRELLKTETEFELINGNEKHESKIMSVLGNENRLKILKELSKGKNYYTNLERTIGLKGGHFNFHLSQLKDADLVSIDNDDRSYNITIKGLKALKMVVELAR
jgi:DNA-binding transcriptional ArsR family regulator